MSNTIIRASAGSGKTFDLSSTFLNVVFQSVGAIEPTLDSILASTFTRKAAGEITDRIFTLFADAALDAGKREELGEHLRYPTSADPAGTLRDLLAVLARNMYRLRVGTLDSYFHKIAAAFALELGLPPGWTMLDENAEYPELLAEAVREVFNESQRNDVKRLMHLLQKGEENARMMRELVELAQTALPLVRATTIDAWKHESPERLGKHAHHLMPGAKIDELAEKIRLLADDRLPQTGKNEYPNARDKIVKAVRSRDWKAFIENSLVQKIIPTLDKPETECKFAWKDVRKDAPELFQIVRELLPHAQSVQIQILIDQTRPTYELLGMIDEKLDAVMERERKYGFDDIARKIIGYGFRNRIDVLWHRLNAETKHLLLDEFQDTSPAQWHILEPLALKAAGDENGTYFCVGDEKQSIYSWRGGEAAIFGSMKSRLLQELGNVKIEETTKERTRRCARPIIDTVNVLFGNVRNSPTVANASKKAGPRWQQRFKKHETTNDKPGYCVLEESPLPPNTTKGEAHLQYVVDRIKRLIPVVRHHPELKDGIGVLVKTRDFGAKIVSALKEDGIETTGSGTVLLQSPAVRHVVSALVFAEHPGDTVARFHLAHGPLAEKIGFLQHDDNYCSRNIREALIDRGYGEVVGEYADILAKSRDANELERLEKLREVAWRFDEVSKGVRTRRFVDMLEKERVAGQNAVAIQVMTIHAAKGLEFDIVVLPQLDEPLEGSARNVKCVTKHRVMDDSTSPVDFVLRYVGEKLQTILPEDYRTVFRNRIRSEVEESLCELYVAMTRAKRSLVMIVPWCAKKKDGTPTKPELDKTSFANVLRELPKPSGSPPEHILYEKGDTDWHGGIDETIMECAARNPVGWECGLNRNTVLHHVPRITPSGLATERKPANPAGKRKSSRNSRDAALKGTVLHACFESVAWLDDPQSGDESELRERIDELLQGRSTSLDVDGLLAEFHAVCRRKEIIAALSRSRYLPDKNPELERERRFAVWIGDKIMRGSIDRLVIQRDPSGEIAKIEILDYKTGDSTEDSDSPVETYREQLNAYRRAVCELYDVDGNIVETTLIFAAHGTTATVPNIQRKG